MCTLKKLLTWFGYTLLVQSLWSQASGWRLLRIVLSKYRAWHLIYENYH